MKKKITSQTLLDLRFVSNPSFSPDGRLAAFCVQRADIRKNGYTGDVYLLNVEDKSVRRLTAGGDASSYIWTKEGKILFSAKRTEEDKKTPKPDENGKDAEKTVYYEIDPSGGEAVKAFELPLSATGIRAVDKDLYVVEAVQNNGESLKNRAYEIIEESPFWFNGRGFTHGLRGNLYLYRRSSGELMSLTLPYFDASLLDVEGNRILFSGAYWRKGLSYQFPALCVFDIETRKTTEIIPKDKVPFYSASFWTEGKVMVPCPEEGANPGMANPKFYVFDTADGSRTLLKDYDRSIGDGSVGSDARLGGGRGHKRAGDDFYFLSTLDESSRLMKINMATGEITGPLTGEGSADSFDVCGGHTLVCGMYGDDVAELYLDGEKVTHFNDELMESLDISTPEYQEFTNSDGIMIHGYVMKPAGYTEGRKYPCILHIHGGPLTVFGSVFHLEMQQWASAGFFVIYCNPRGADGRGNAFQDICNKYGTIDYQDLMEFTDEMLRRFPDIDETRLGVTGGSYGGFMTNWIIGHTSRFKAACSQRSIANWVVFEHTSDIGYSFTKYHQGARTRENVEQLWDHSPLKYADQCTTPTLFIHSDMDKRCWMADGLSMFTALKMHDCPARLVLFHDETHELSRSGKPRNRIKRMDEITAWMKKYLASEEEEA